MPTYVFTSAKKLTDEQRAKLAESITSIHHVEAVAPRYFVQVIFNEVDPGSMFIGGESAPSDQIWVRADIRSGRTKEQKARILKRVMQTTSEILGISEQCVWVYVFEIPAHGFLEFGNILPEPGQEDQWLASLPSPLRERLTKAS